MTDHFTIKAPGRVNLLGEHTDYNGLPVLPMAINRHICIKGAPVSHLQITVTAMGETVEFELSDTIPKHPAGHWCNYVKAGMQGAFVDFIQNKAIPVFGCEMTITGTIPQNAGLSSSSALVVAAALALLQANQIDVDRMQLAESMARAEHYVGTRGGGMDQAASLLAVQNHIMKMDFFPLRIQQVPFPEDLAVVICHSGVQAKKSAEAVMQFNLRAAECRLALALLKKLCPKLSQVMRLGDLLHPPFGYTSIQIQSLIQEHLQDEYSEARLRDTMQDDEMINTLFIDYGLNHSSAGNLTYACGKRFRHVISDAARVEAACKSLQNHDIQQFCSLINAGHISARDDFEISCLDIEALIACAQHNGAMASRITGAGFGGSTVNIVNREHVEHFIQKMKEQFYNDGHWTTMEPITACQPANGASIQTS